MFASSQVSPAFSTPLPQLAAQVLRAPMAPEHPKPDSIVQVAEHPSPGVVFPSSQSSLLARRASPQVVRHVEGVPVQVHAVSVTQVAEHPSPAVAFESSHVSAPTAMRPSPQTERHDDGLPGAHVQPVVTVQPTSQPSPDVMFPSSQTSGPPTTPSPQNATAPGMLVQVAEHTVHEATPYCFSHAKSPLHSPAPAAVPADRSPRHAHCEEDPVTAFHLAPRAVADVALGPRRAARY